MELETSSPAGEFATSTTVSTALTLVVFAGTYWGSVRGANMPRQGIESGGVESEIEPNEIVNRSVHELAPLTRNLRLVSPPDEEKANWEAAKVAIRRGTGGGFLLVVVIGSEVVMDVVTSVLEVGDFGEPQDARTNPEAASNPTLRRLKPTTFPFH